MSILQILLVTIAFFAIFYVCLFIGKEIIIFFSYPEQEKQYTLEDIKQAETSYTESAKVRKYFLGRIYFPIIILINIMFVFSNLPEKDYIVFLSIASFFIWGTRTYKGIYLENLFMTKNYEDL